MSDYLAADGELGRTRQFHHKYDSALNVIEEKPNNVRTTLNTVHDKQEVGYGRSEGSYPPELIEEPHAKYSNQQATYCRVQHA